MSLTPAERGIPIAAFPEPGGAMSCGTGPRLASVVRPDFLGAVTIGAVALDLFLTNLRRRRGA